MPDNDPIISADSHVNPLPTFWAEYLPAACRDRAPKLEQTAEGDFIAFEGQRTPFGTLNAMAGRQAQEYIPSGKVSDTRPGGWDPVERLKDLDIDRVEAEALFGGGPIQTEDLELHRASFRPYNTWLAEFCRTAPERLLGMAYIPTWDVDGAVAEVRFAAARGMRGVVIPAFPPAGTVSAGTGSGGSAAVTVTTPDEKRSYADPEFDRLWETVIDTGVVLHMHLGARGSRTRQDAFMASMLMSKLTMAEPVAQLIFSGLFAKYPDLKLVSVESQVGWFAFAADYMDHLWEKHRFWTNSPLKERPSFYMDRQVYGTFMDDPVGVKLRNETGGRNIMWASDYPHSETTWPRSHEVIAAQFAGVPEAEKRAIVYDRVRQLYGLG